MKKEYKDNLKLVKISPKKVINIKDKFQNLMNKVDILEEESNEIKSKFDDFLEKYLTQIEPIEKQNNDYSKIFARKVDMITRKYKFNKNEKELIAEIIKDLYLKIDWDDDSLSKDFEIIKKWAGYDVRKEILNQRKEFISEFKKDASDKMGFDIDELGLDFEKIVDNPLEFELFQKKAYEHAFKSNQITLDDAIEYEPTEIDFENTNFLDPEFLTSIVFHYFHNLKDPNLSLEEIEHLNKQRINTKDLKFNKVIIEELNWIRKNNNLILSKDDKYIGVYLNMLNFIIGIGVKFFFDMAEHLNTYNPILKFYKVVPDQFNEAFYFQRLSEKMLNAKLEFYIDQIDYIKDKDDFIEFLDVVDIEIPEFGEDDEDDEDFDDIF